VLEVFGVNAEEVIVVSEGYVVGKRNGCSVGSDTIGSLSFGLLATVAGISFGIIAVVVVEGVAELFESMSKNI
jgi:hypothetical protein